MPTFKPHAANSRGSAAPVEVETITSAERIAAVAAILHALIDSLTADVATSFAARSMLAPLAPQSLEDPNHPKLELARS